MKRSLRLASRRKLPKVSRRGQIRLALTLLVVFLIWLMAHWLASPAQGHIIAVHDTLTTSSSSLTKPPVASAPVSNNLFSLQPPPGYSLQPGAATPPGLLYSQTLTKASASGSLIIAIAVKTMPDGGLSGDASYHLRQQQTFRYTLSQQAFGADSVTIANDQQSAAVVAFWPHGNYLATISISSGLDNPVASDNADELAALQPLLRAWQWQ